MNCVLFLSFDQGWFFSADSCLHWYSCRILPHGVIYILAIAWFLVETNLTSRRYTASPCQTGRQGTDFLVFVTSPPFILSASGSCLTLENTNLHDRTTPLPTCIESVIICYSKCESVKTEVQIACESALTVNRELCVCLVYKHEWSVTSWHPQGMSWSPVYIVCCLYSKTSYWISSVDQ